MGELIFGNGIKVIDDTVDVPKEKDAASKTSQDKKKYTVNYIISYSDYCSENDKKDATEEEKQKFINDFLVHFREEATAEEVCRFFIIPDTKEYLEKINNRDYTIDFKIIQNDTKNLIIRLKVTLEIK